MKVKIIKCFSCFVWYQEYIGKTLEATDSRRGTYIFSDGKEALRTDCVIITNENEYPTIKELYF